MVYTAKALAPAAGALCAAACCALGACAAGGLPRLELSCAADDSGDAPVLTALARLTDGSALGEPVAVTIAIADQTHTFSVQGGHGQGLGSFSGVPVSAGSVLHASARTPDGVDVQATCRVATELAPPDPAAQATPSGARVSWPSVHGARLYRVTALDFTNGTTLASATVGDGASPVALAFSKPADHVAVVELVADAVDPARDQPVPLPAPARSRKQVLLTAGSDGGSGAAWQLFGPGDFVDGTLQIAFADLGSDEHVALVLANAGGSDSNAEGGSDGGVPAASVSVTGTGAPLAGGAVAVALSMGTAQQVDLGTEEPARERQRQAEAAILGRSKPRPEIAAGAAPKVGDRHAFCVCDWSSGACARQRRAQATVRFRSPHAAFFVDDAAQAGFDDAIANGFPSLWQDLGNVYETQVLPAIEGAFGTPTDVNQDGVMWLLFADLGPSSGEGMMIGNFDVHDAYYPSDTTPDCSGEGEGRGSNGADLLYLRDLASFVSEGGADFTPERVLGELYPNSMAHELQHDINFNVHWRLGRAMQGPVAEESWLDEGLSMVAEDVAGYGLARPAARNSIRRYLQRYPGFSLTSWDGDVYGNYGGAHAFLRYFMDRQGDQLARRLENAALTGKASFEAATGLPFALALARFATASLFSNEPFSPDPGFDYTGPSWTPWYSAVGPARYQVLEPHQPGTVYSLRTDGWTSYVTGTGSGGPVVISVHSEAALRPYVVAVRFKGELP